MSVRVYDGIAQAFRLVRFKHVDGDSAPAVEAAINAAAIEVADALQRADSSGRFIRSRFLGACQVPSPEVA